MNFNKTAILILLHLLALLAPAFAFSQVCAVNDIAACTGNGCQYRYTMDGISNNPHQMARIPFTIDLGDLPDSCYTGAGVQITVTGMNANGPIYDIPSPLVLFVTGTQPQNANISANCNNTYYDPGIAGIQPSATTTNEACTVVTFDMANLLQIPGGGMGMSAAVAGAAIQYKRWVVAVPPYCVNTPLWNELQAPLIAGGMAPALAASTTRAAAEIGPNVTISTYTARHPVPPTTCSGTLQTSTCNIDMSGQFTVTSDPLGNSTTCENGCVVSGTLNVPVGANTYYSTTTPVGTCASVSQVRTCSPGDNTTTLGTMDGNAANQYLTCTPGCGTIDGIDMRHGDSRVFYTAASSFDCASKAETRTCNNGVMDVLGTATNANCNPAPLNAGECGVLYRVGATTEVNDHTIPAGTSWTPLVTFNILNYGGAVINGPNLDCQLCSPASATSTGCPVIANGTSTKTCAGDGMSWGACTSSCDGGYASSGAQPNISCNSGTCGAATTDPASRTSPVLNLCSSGGASAVTGNAGLWEWTCGGAVACSAPRIYIVGQTSFADSDTAIFDAGTCCVTGQIRLHTGGAPANGQWGTKCIDLAGTVTSSGVTDNFNNSAVGGAFNLTRWSDGLCEAPAVGGAVTCGAAAGTTVGSKPVANLCSDGSTPAVNYYGFWHNNRYWHWTCGGNNCYADSNLVWSYCFVGGTKVTMADGSKKDIEDIQVGEKVLTYDEVSKQQIIRPVSEAIHHDSRWTDLYSFEFSDGSKVTSNDEHRFFIADREIYLSAEQIYKKWSAGESVKMLNSSRQLVQVTAISIDHKNVPLYNLHVEGLYDQGDENDLYTKSNHNYFAGNILVHNRKNCGGDSSNTDMQGVVMMCEGANDACNPSLNLMECRFGTNAEKTAFCACADAAYDGMTTTCSRPSCGVSVATCQAETKTWGGNCSATIPATQENTTTGVIANTAVGFTGSAQFRCEAGASSLTVQAGATCN